MFSSSSTTSTRRGLPSGRVRSGSAVLHGHHSVGRTTERSMSPLCVSCERNPRTPGHRTLDTAREGHSRYIGAHHGPMNDQPDPRQPAHAAAPARSGASACCPRTRPCSRRSSRAAAQGAVRRPALVAARRDRGRAGVGDPRWPRRCRARQRRERRRRPARRTGAAVPPRRAGHASAGHAAVGGTDRATVTTNAASPGRCRQPDARPHARPDAHPGEADAHPLTDRPAWSARAAPGRMAGLCASTSLPTCRYRRVATTSRRRSRTTRS